MGRPFRYFFGLRTYPTAANAVCDQIVFDLALVLIVGVLGSHFR